MRPHARPGLAAVAGGALLALAQGCAGAPATDPTPPSRARTAAPSLDAGTAATPLDPHVRGWEREHAYAYKLKSANFVEFGSEASAFDFDLVGTLRLVAVAAAPDAATLFLAIPDATVVSRVPRSQQEFDKIAKQVSRAYAFVDLSGGHVARLHLPSGIAPVVANTFRSVASALQFERPSQPASEYEAEEYDATGKYVARYQRDPAGDVWTKQKVRYLSLLSPKTTTPALSMRLLPEVTASTGEIRLSADGRPQTVEIHDEFVVAGAQVPVHTRTGLSLESVPSNAADAADRDWTALLAATAPLSPDEPYAAATESLDAARIGGLTFEGVVSQLEARGEPSGEDSVRSTSGAPPDSVARAREEARTKDDSRLFIALAAILRTQPSKVPLAVRRIRSHSAAARDLVDALGSASTPESQKALVELSNSVSLDPKLRSRALASLTQTPRPAEVSIDALKTTLLTDPFNGPALLGLGSYSRRLRDAGKIDAANEIGALLIDRLPRAKSQGELRLVTVLRAIANSGYTPALGAVSAYLEDPLDEVRAAAVRSLQSMRGPNVDEILASRLHADPSPEVRSSVLAAAKVRGPSDVLVRAVASAATEADDPHVRYDAVRLLIQWAPQRSDIHATLDSVARNDAENRIRDVAKAAL